MVDDVVRRRKGPDPRLDADGPGREAQRNCGGFPRGAEMGKRAFLLFQITPEESTVEANLFARQQTHENSHRWTDYFIPVKRA